MELQGVFLVAIFSLANTLLVKGQPQPREDCPKRCGNISIEYPFGISSGCYYLGDPSFNITCNERDELIFGGNQVINISHSGELRVRVDSSYTCYNSRGKLNGWSYSTFTLANLTLSPKNRFTAVGCSTYAFLRTYGVNNYSSGCMAVCDSPPKANEECSGRGCCQTSSIPRGSNYFSVRPYSFDNQSSVHSFNPCSYAFLVEDGMFNFSARKDLLNLRNITRFPVLLDWSIGNQTCEQAGNSSICGGNSKCLNSTRGIGYICKCNDGFDGNPYLSDGCQDINECTSGRHNCSDTNTCINMVGGGFYCRCPSGYRLDTTTMSCKSNDIGRATILLGIGASFGSLIFVSGIYLLFRIIRKQRRLNQKKKLFKRNGGLLLQQQLTSTEGNVEKTKVFSSRELEKATENFSTNRILGQGGQGTVYKGMLVDGRIVAVKKSKVVDEDKLEEFINEVVILSQINHRNIVKLLGCCLETNVPVLVYEFIPNGNLFEHLHDEFDDNTMATWKIRLRIATDIAGALSYLHSYASSPIYHRDVKSTNIMLDEKFRAKVSDFGTSRSVTVDHTHLTTVVSGTAGYMDPEYFQSSQFTDKSDVYSFGVVLVELITGEKSISFLRSQENRTLATYFISVMKENKLFDIIDARIRDGCMLNQVTATAKVARKCLNMKRRKRPSMREVLMELDHIRLSSGDMQPHECISENEEEEEKDKGGVEDNIWVESGSNEVVTAPASQYNIVAASSSSWSDVEPLFPLQTR